LKPSKSETFDLNMRDNEEVKVPFDKKYSLPAVNYESKRKSSTRNSRNKRNRKYKRKQSPDKDIYFPYLDVKKEQDMIHIDNKSNTIKSPSLKKRKSKVPVENKVQKLEALSKENPHREPNKGNY
jgi:hypothetical protein